MSISYDPINIQKFIEERIELQDFCEYLIHGIKISRGITLNQIAFKKLPSGANVGTDAKVRFIRDKVGEAGYLPDLVFYLTNFWIKEVKGKEKILRDAKLHHDLCISAQELWQENKLRELAKNAFNLLAKLNEDFKLEWEKTKNGEMLKNVSSLGPYMTIEDLTQLLAKSRGLYENVMNHIKNNRLLDARNSYIQLEKLLPGYGCRDEIPFVVRLINKEEILRLQNVDLCKAAQELWRDNELRPLAIEAFYRLAELHEGFKREWEKAQKGEMLKNVPNLGPDKNIDEMTELLAKCRESYENVMNYMKNHHFLDARNSFIELDQLLPGYGEDLEHLAHLKNEDEIRKLQNIIGAAESRFVHDDRLPWEAKNPYVLFRELSTSITPASSNKTVQEELQKLKKQQGGIPDEICTILETLIKNTDERLFVDAFLYPVLPSEKTVISIINDYFKEGQLPTSEKIKKKYPDDSAILLFLLGRTDEAEIIWKKAQKENPLEGQPAHCLGLLYLGLANDKSNTDPEKRMEYWQAAIAHWTMTLANTVYWIRWGQEHCRNYNTPFVFAAIYTLINKIKSYLRNLLDKKNGEEIPTTEGMEKLKLDFNIEFEAVRLFNALEGIDLGEGRLTWLGPLGMVFYNYENVVGSYLARFTPDPLMEYSLLGQLSPGEALRRLRWYFSYLRIPAILVTGPEQNLDQSLKLLNPTAALQDKDCHYPNCPVHGGQQYPVLVLCTSRKRFQAENPAYNAQDKAGKQMCEDALQLAIEAHSLLAKEHIYDLEQTNPVKLKEHWQEILKLANYSQYPNSGRERIRNMVMEETNPIPKDMTRINAAVTIIDTCLNTLSEGYREVDIEVKEEESLKDHALKTRLAELLTSWGIKKVERQDIPGAEVDLMRALDIAPHLNSSRIQLATLWAGQAMSFVRSDRFLAQDFLRKAEDLIEKGEEEYKGYDYSDLKNWIHQMKINLFQRPANSAAAGNTAFSTSSTGTHTQAPSSMDTSRRGSLYSEGIRELRDGQPDTALNMFSQALTAAPEDKDIQAIIPAALMEQALRLTKENRNEDAVKKVQEWMERLPSQQERMGRQLEFLKGLPYIQPWFDAPKNFDIQLTDYQEGRLVFPEQSIENEFSWIRARVEGDYFSLTALIPLLSAAEREIGLLNLLQVTTNIMFRLAYADKSELALKCLVPLRLLDPLRLLNPAHLLEPGWFSQTASDLFKFSDISGKKIFMRDALQSYFREIETASRQRHSNHHIQDSTSALKKICKERRLPYERMTDVYYKLDKGRIEVKSQANGTRFFTSLGKLQTNPNRQVQLEKIVKYNTDLKQCKLALDENMNVILSIEWPYLDETAVSEALRLLKEKSVELAPELVE